SGLNAGAATGGGSFSWPVPCSSRVTSRFGYRTDPFTGASAGHAGIDIDGFGNDGAAVVAAAGGTVVTATTGGGGYGTYVLIDHGNGYQTVYAHLSGLAVSSGDSVGTGQTIGYLGATGRATGTHCHFEIRQGGTPIDPEQYFSGLSHWNC
ncbi:MAG: M23 family metallopeptidase, partial [Oscillospiraceae bacterium]|nr:M23 family metallopeptidase [Oscillospiraceae bacterium]